MWPLTRVRDVTEQKMRLDKIHLVFVLLENEEIFCHATSLRVVRKYVDLSPLGLYAFRRFRIRLAVQCM